MTSLLRSEWISASTISFRPNAAKTYWCWSPTRAGSKTWCRASQKCHCHWWRRAGRSGGCAATRKRTKNALRCGHVLFTIRNPTSPCFSLQFGRRRRATASTKQITSFWVSATSQIHPISFQALPLYKSANDESKLLLSEKNFFFWLNFPIRSSYIYVEVSGWNFFFAERLMTKLITWLFMLRRVESCISSKTWNQQLKSDNECTRNTGTTATEFIYFTSIFNSSNKIHEKPEISCQKRAATVSERTSIKLCTQIHLHNDRLSFERVKNIACWCTPPWLCALVLLT